MTNKKLFNLISFSKQYFQLLYLVIFLFALVLIVSWNKDIGVLMADEIQPWRNSFLIFSGQVPYRDFFEHHNPFLYWVLAPFHFFFYRDARVFIISRLLVYIFTFGCIFFGIRILDFLNTNKITNRIFYPLVFFLYILMQIHSSYFTNRPDLLMMFLFLMGLYYFFDFVKTDKIGKIQFSFICFFLSFWTLQKIVILFPIIMFGSLYIFWHKKMKIGRIIQACLPAGILFLSILTYLILTGSIKDYIICNFSVNIALSEIYCPNMKLFELPNITLLLSVISIPFFMYKNRTFYGFTILGLFLVALISSIRCDPGVSSHYRIPLIVLSSILVTSIIPGIFKADRKLKIFASILATISILCCFGIQYSRSPLKDYIHNYDDLLSKIPEDAVVGQPNFSFNIWNPYPHYIGFSYKPLQRIHQRHPELPDIDPTKDILRYKPDIIFRSWYLLDNTVLDDMLHKEYERIPNAMTKNVWRKKEKR